MKRSVRCLFHVMLIVMPLVLFLGGTSGEIVSQKKADPYEREDCRACHKGSQRHQIDDTRGPWCVPCHKLHQVGTTLGLKTYSKQLLRIAEEGQNQDRQPKIVVQEMVSIPAGDFIMGENFTKKSLGPRHSVFVDAFLIDRYHVTNAHYQVFVDAMRWLPPPHWFGVRHPASKSNHPVSFVNWFDASAYCKWAGKRLPTEAEWEKAARGSDGRMFPWGPKYLPMHANVYQEGYGDTTPVDSFPEGRSPYGLYDMAGNLFQWTSDWFLPYPGNAVPHPNFGETLRVLRGGSFYDCSNYRCGISFQTFNRISLLPQTRAISAGFRCAKSAEPRSEKSTDTDKTEGVMKE
ncbi:MAG: formylglycine-generating enzyme family protein [Nitrospiria bacterium]